jgi:hypothetical protein
MLARNLVYKLMHIKFYTFMSRHQNVGPNHKKRTNKHIEYVTKT